MIMMIVMKAKSKKSKQQKKHLVLSLIPPAQVLLHSPHRLHPPQLPNLLNVFLKHICLQI